LTASHEPAAYDQLGQGYILRRRPDPRIAQALRAALGSAQRIVNVGAGTGSYEPPDRSVVAVEPSTVMIAQRAPGAAPVVQAVAEALPFADGTFDAGLIVLSAHHWQNLDSGLREVRRVVRERIVILSWDPTAGQSFWLTAHYLPQLLDFERDRFDYAARMASILGPLDQHALPIPADCTDGFLGAYWGRPEAYLDPQVRASISTFHLLDESQVEEGLNRLALDLSSGAWGARFGSLRREVELDVGYCILIAEH
jgi:SAM-dependent methyltransferase